jgi:acetylornithine deacetylase
MAEPILELPEPSLRQEIEAAVQAGFPAQVELTRELVQRPSLRGSEADAQDLMERVLRARGYAVERWPIEPAELTGHPGASPVDVDYAQATNVVAHHTPREHRGHSLVLQGHVDVVPPGPLDMWRHPPFAAVVEDGWLYGRGAGDMKSGLIAAVAAMDALAAAGYRPAAPVQIQSVVEEESTGNGALACHLRGLTAEAALIPEPSAFRLVRANLGVLWFKIEVRGRPVHVSEATSGANAIVSVHRLLVALKDVETLWNEARRLDRCFRDHPHPINIQVGRIEGGDWPSSVPAWCTLHCRAAFYPSVDPAMALDELRRAIEAAAARDPFLAHSPPVVTCNGFHCRGYVLEPGSSAERLLGRAHEAVGGQPLATTVLPAYLDARVFALYDGIPALTYGAVAENVHGFDERVSLASLQRLTSTLALFVAGWCGLERS